MATHKPPQSVVNNYKRGLKAYEEGKGGSGLEQSTIRQARKIAKGGSVSDEWVRKANRFWGRNDRFLKEPSDSPAYTSALLWGGAAGRDWYKSRFSKIKGNSTMKQALLFCTQKVNQSDIKREIRDSVEHIIITSYTLPPNIVMNGGLYPTEEVENSYLSLNRTPVTVEHPAIDGQYVSASDPQIDFEYRFGAYNENARRTDDGRIALDKVINVQKANMVPSGKRLIDRLNEIESNPNARPIHTSVGVFLNVEDLDEPQTNDNGQEYTWIGRDMVFDHDAILLDSVGASTPEQGTGIGVNNEKVNVKHFVLSEHEQKDSIDSDEIIEDEYQPKTNEDNAMRDNIIAKLESMGIEVNSDIQDDALMAQYEEALFANKGDDEEEKEEKVSKGDHDMKAMFKKLSDRMSKMESKMKSNSEDEMNQYVSVVANSEIYKGFSAEELKELPLSTVKKMAANCGSAYSIGPTHMQVNQDNDSAYTVNTNIDELPE